MKWYIGQDVVCIKTHSSNVVKKDNVYTIQGLQKGCCNIILDVGIKSLPGFTRCDCGGKTKDNSDAHWISEKLFTPLEQITDISEIEAILNEPIYN